MSLMIILIFTMYNSYTTLTNNEKESLIELLCDKILKKEFNTLELNVFWIKIINEYPKALLFVLSFKTTHLISL